MQAPDLLFLVSSQEEKELSLKVSSSEFPAALSVGEFVTGPPCSELTKRTKRVLSIFEVFEYSSSQCPVSSSWI
jgi:hypothetical protein